MWAAEGETTVTQRLRQEDWDVMLAVRPLGRHPAVLAPAVECLDSRDA